MSENGQTEHVPHPTLPVSHDGPGHYAGDPGYCGGCWWEQFGRYQPETFGFRHAADCPACAKETK